jgi:hypothetical protein
MSKKKKPGKLALKKRPLRVLETRDAKAVQGGKAREDDSNLCSIRMTTFTQ